jgi:hypothetical protein
MAIFHSRSRPLHNLQVFDNASRGPWGAFIVLASRMDKAWIVTALAAVTLLATGIEFSAQQILSYSFKEGELVNTTATAGIATAYIPTSFSILSVMPLLGPVSAEGLYCVSPASRCSWPAHVTLAVCSDVQNVTNAVKP